jgi:hypothetical protein
MKKIRQDMEKELNKDTQILKNQKSGSCLIAVLFTMAKLCKQPGGPIN